MKFIIPSIVGAIIGYVTNWLAIKMLFRPHEEKRFLGIKIPFTPGLIPKERYRVAKSVGETIGTHLLSKDTMVEALSSDKVHNQIENWIKHKVYDLSNSDVSIKIKLEKELKNSFKDFSSLKHRILEDLVSNIDENLINTLEKSLFDFIEVELEKNPESFTHIIDHNFRNNLWEKVKDIKQSEEALKAVREAIALKINEVKQEDLSIKEILPMEVVNSLKVYVYNQRDDISESLIELVKQPVMEDKIKAAIGKAVSSNVNPLVAMFLNSETLYNKFINFVEDYTALDENKRDIAIFINSFLDKALNTKLALVIESISKEEEELIGNKLSMIILDSLFKEGNVETALNLLKSKLNSKASVDEILKVLDENYKEKLKKFIHEKITEIKHKESTKVKIKRAIEGFVDNLLEKPVSSLVRGREENIISIANKVAEGMFNNFINNEAGEIVELLNIEKIVEDKINSFDVAFAEKIILEIANKELKAITWLGALLGGIMGILTPFLSQLYM